MVNNSSVHLPTTWYIFVFTGSVDHMIGLSVNCWALWLIVSEKRRLVESEVLTLNLVIMETGCSICFFLDVISTFSQLFNFYYVTYFYVVVAVLGRALFQCHVCVDRYLAVVHPVAFLRYKQIKYRGACLAVVWLVIICCGMLNCFIPLSFTVLYTSFALLVPAFFTELFCSLSIVRILRRPVPADRGTQERKEGNQQKKRAVKITWMVLFMLVLNVLPFILVPFFKGVSLMDLLPIAFTVATVGSSAQAFFFLSRSGRLPCKN